MTRKISNMNNLQLLLSSRFWTIKDLYAEVILIMCHTLLSNYLEDEKENKDKVNDVITLEENQLIFDFMENLFEYLSQNVLSYSRTQQILLNATNNKNDHMKARLVEPFSYYYNALVNAFVSRLNFVTKEKDPQKYIPDLIVIELIKYYKENYYLSAFKRFSYIDKLDLKSISQIYINVQLKEKKRLNLSINSPIQEQTLIRKMRNIAHFMVDKMVEIKYSKTIKR